MTMKLFSALALLTLATAVQADILYQYDFNTDGRITNTPSWRAYSGGDGTVTNGGGVAWVGGGTEDVGATNVYAAQSGQFYAGVTLTISDNGSDGQYICGLMTGNGVMSGRLYATNVTASTFRLGLAGDSTTPVYLGTDLDVGTSYRIVMGYNNGTDTHTLWIDPLTSEVATPDLTITEAVTGSPNGFFIRQSTTWGAGLAAWTLDDLSVATDFENAVTVVPEPSAFAFLVLGAALLRLRRR